MNDHPPEHDQLLERALAADGPPDDATRAAIERCPRCRELHAALVDVQDGLARSGAEQRSVLAEVDAVDDRAAATAMAREFVERVRGPRAASSRPWTRWAIAGALAAAAAVVVFVVLRDRAHEVEPRRIHLGDDAIRPLEPIGEQRGAYAAFRWEASVAPGTLFRLTIRGVDAEGRAFEKALPDLDQPRWMPSAPEEALLPASIEWRVEADQVNGDDPRSEWAQASRGSR